MRKPTDKEMSVLVVAARSLTPSIIFTNGPLNGQSVASVALETLTAISDGNDNPYEELR